MIHRSQIGVSELNYQYIRFLPLRAFTVHLQLVKHVETMWKWELGDAGLSHPFRSISPASHQRLLGSTDT